MRCFLTFQVFFTCKQQRSKCSRLLGVSVSGPRAGKKEADEMRIEECTLLLTPV